MLQAIFDKFHLVYKRESTVLLRISNYMYCDPHNKFSDRQIFSNSLKSEQLFFKRTK